MRRRVAVAVAVVLTAAVLPPAALPLRAGMGTCPVELSPFAEATVQALQDRFCDEAQDGWTHENLPTTDPVQREKDTIFTLLAFALVAVEWDPDRGHQISGVIVDEDTDVVLWTDFNSNFANNSPIDHAEARAVRNYVQHVNDEGTSTPYWALLEGTTVYASLEPCQMCAGTINMARVDRVVFGMEDPGFGDALDYLHAFPFHADFEFHSGTATAQALIDEVAQHPNTSVTGVIAGARWAFDLAVDDLRSLTLQYSQNLAALSNALAVLQSHIAGPPPVPNGTFGAPLTAERSAADGSRITVHWDAASCPAADYVLLHGPLAGVEALELAGAACQLGGAGTFLWQGVPAGDTWFLVVADEGQTEGSWGTDSSGAQRNGSRASGLCGNLLRDNTTTCP